MLEYLNTLCQLLVAYPEIFLVAFFILSFVAMMAIWSIIAVAIKNIKEKNKRKKQARDEAQRQLKFALPDKENSFIRERLQQVLNVPEVEAVEEIKTERTCFEFLYAQKLLNQLAEQNVSMTERLELMEINKFLGANLQKIRWGVEDIRAINECFSRILKLSAKYAIVP